MASSPPPVGSPGWVSAPARGAEPSRWTARLALLVAFLACILAVIGWFRPAAESEAPQYSAAEVAAAREKVCGAFELVDRALRTTSNAEIGSDVALGQAVAANGRLALLAGAVNLRDAMEPALSKDLAGPSAELSAILSEMSLRLLGGALYDDPRYVSLKQRGDLLADNVQADC